MLTLWLTAGILINASSAPPPVPPALDPIYSAAWMPVIKVDRDGKRVVKAAEISEIRDVTIEAVAPDDRSEAIAAIARIEQAEREALQRLATMAEMDMLIADIRAVSDMLPGMQAALIAEWDALAADMEARAEDERDVELLLMLA
jgi:hypothetical protein